MEKINVVNVLDFMILNYCLFIFLLMINKIICDSLCRFIKYDVDNDGMGWWVYKESEYLGMYYW